MESEKLEFEREKWKSIQRLEDKKVEVQADTASFEREKWLAQKTLDEKHLEIEEKRLDSLEKATRLQLITACLANGKSIEDLERISQMFGF